MIKESEICCDAMERALEKVGEVPLTIGRKEDHNLHTSPQYVDQDKKIIVFGNDIGGPIAGFCPFCGEKVSVFKLTRSGNWKRRKKLCKILLGYLNFDVFEESDPDRMFEYDHRNNQFYMHKRRGFGDGLIPIAYCVYCGEPLSEMVEKYGIPDEIKNCLHTDEWWKKRGL